MMIRAVLFDVFGTLLDLNSLTPKLEQLFPGRGARLTELWRAKQLEYTRLRTMSGRYANFTRITEDALLFAGDRLCVDVDAAARGALMHEYTQLTLFADANSALKRLRDKGLTLGVLSNADPALLEDNLRNAGLDDFFDVILSADQVKAFKTSNLIYELGPQTLRHPAREIAFVSANGWDAVGAKWFGYLSFWVNRDGAPLERLDAVPDGSGSSLEDAATFILKSIN